jgi:NarL family two-component system response regulator YdfI
MAIKALIVDDHTFFRQTLKSYIEGAGAAEVIGEATDGDEAIECVERLRPQIVIMDINMPRLNGIKACALIKEKSPDLPLILYTMESPDIYLRYGDLQADACLSKDRLFEELLTIIESFSTKITSTGDMKWIL